MLATWGSRVGLRSKRAGVKVGAATAAVLMFAVASACGSPSAGPSGSASSGLQAEPGAGFGPPLPNASAGDKWWLTSKSGTINLQGGPASAIARLFLTLVPTPCGPAELTLGGYKYTVDKPTPVAVVLGLDADGSASTTLSAASAFCQPKNEQRTLFALVAEPTAEQVGSAGSTVAEPISGFANREGTEGAHGYWLIQRSGVVEVVGKPSATATVSLSLVPTPCGPSTVMLAGKKYAVSQSVAVSVPVMLNSAGSASIPISASNQPCSPTGDTRTLYLMVFNPTAAS